MPKDDAAPSAEAMPLNDSMDQPMDAQGSGSPSKSPAKKTEEEVVDDGDKDELWFHKWTHQPLETIQKEPFYRVIGRTGIQYGPCFRMVKRVNVADNAAMMRWASCLLCVGGKWPLTSHYPSNSFSVVVLAIECLVVHDHFLVALIALHALRYCS